MKVLLDCVFDILGVIFEFTIKFWVYSEKMIRFYAFLCVFFIKSALKVLLNCVSDILSMIFEFSIKFWIYSKKVTCFYVCYLVFCLFIANIQIPKIHVIELYRSWYISYHHNIKTKLLTTWCQIVCKPNINRNSSKKTTIR